MKNRVLNSLSILIPIVVIVGTTGCGGGGSSDDSSTPTIEPKANTISFSGVVVDGYISGATACLDLNINGLCDTGEPTTTTQNDGTFSFTDIEIEKNLLLPVIVKGGVDTATGKAFKGELKNIVDAQSVNSSTSLHVTPLTDLVASAYMASSDKSATELNQFKSDIASSLGVSSERVDADPMLDKELFAKAQEVQQLKELMLTSVLKATNTLAGSDAANAIAKNISLAIAKSMQESGGLLSVSLALATLEALYSNLAIPANEKEFIDLQLKEIRATLETMVKESTVTTDNLNEKQKELEERVEVASKNIEDATKDSKIEVVVINPPACIQVISYATNPTTGSCQEFPTPCDIPSGWLTCEVEATPIVADIPTPPAPPVL